MDARRCGREKIPAHRVTGRDRQPGTRCADRPAALRRITSCFVAREKTTKPPSCRRTEKPLHVQQNKALSDAGPCYPRRHRSRRIRQDSGGRVGSLCIRLVSRSAVWHRAAQLCDSPGRGGRIPNHRVRTPDTQPRKPPRPGLGGGPGGGLPPGGWEKRYDLRKAAAGAGGEAPLTE